MHELLVNRLGGLSLPRKSVLRLTDRPDMTLDVYRGRKTTIQQHQEKPPFAKKANRFKAASLIRDRTHCRGVGYGYKVAARSLDHFQVSPYDNCQISSK